MGTSWQAEVLALLASSVLRGWNIERDREKNAPGYVVEKIALYRLVFISLKEFLGQYTVRRQGFYSGIKTDI